MKALKSVLNPSPTMWLAQHRVISHLQLTIDNHDSFEIKETSMLQIKQTQVFTHAQIRPVTDQYQISDRSRSSFCTSLESSKIINLNAGNFDTRHIQICVKQ